ncbi:MAG: thiolase family protein, partial [Actinobacteria bacterium]|nr:thiolase family protein [Actinomycetota bacterium]
MDVAIVGIGLHPFGRHEGVSDVDMGVYASRQAMRHAGVEWRDVQFAVGGSLGQTLGGGASPDTLVSRLGLTGLQFINVSNGCA